MSRLPCHPNIMLDFEKSAKVVFAFLERSLEFKPHLVAEGLLRYEGKDVFVIVSYDSKRSFELSLSLGQKGATVERAFNFGEVLRSVKAPEDVASAYQVTSDEALNEFLNTLVKNLLGLTRFDGHLSGGGRV